jgi:hypothetical protein
MKALQTLFFMALTVLIMPNFAMGQDSNIRQAFWVHEDVVKPSKVGQYEAVCKELVANLKKYNIQGINTIVANLSDNRYLYVGPLENMAQLDKPMFATLSEKMGKEALDNLFGRMDECYDLEQNYVINLDKELTYMPEGITQTPTGQDYRKFHYLYFAPKDRKSIHEKMKAVKDVFAKKGSKMYYRVYRSGFGTRGDFYMVAIAAKDAVDYEQKSMENGKLLGEEGDKALGELFGNLLRYEEFLGRMRPDLAYSPQK